MNGRASKADTFATDRKGQADIWTGGASDRQSEALSLIVQANLKADTLNKELDLRDKWIQLLRAKLKATANQKEDFSKELKKVKSSFLYRLIK